MSTFSSVSNSLAQSFMSVAQAALSAATPLQPFNDPLFGQSQGEVSNADSVSSQSAAIVSTGEGLNSSREAAESKENQ